MTGLANISLTIAVIAAIFAGVAFSKWLTHRSAQAALTTCVSAICAIAGVVGFASFSYVESTLWTPGQATVYNVADESRESTLLITAGNGVYHCVVPEECTSLQPGDNVVFMESTKGKFPLEDGYLLRDIKDVQKV